MSLGLLLLLLLLLLIYLALRPGLSMNYKGNVLSTYHGSYLPGPTLFSCCDEKIWRLSKVEFVKS